MSLRPDAEFLAVVLKALAWQVNQPRWTKDGGAYVPLLGTWLRAGQWDDEPFEAPASPSQLPPARESSVAYSLRNAKELMAEMDAHESLMKPSHALPKN